MTVAAQQFKENIKRVHALLALYDALTRQTTSIVDLSDLLRTCHVMAVSAVDHYVHEVTRSAMMEIFDGERTPTPAYKRFKISMECLSGMATVAAARSNVEAEIRHQHSFLSFQQPDKIADAIRHAVEVKLWDEVGFAMEKPAKDVRDRLTLIVDRRNKVAHEADLDPTYPNTRWPIKSSDVADTLNFLTDMVRAIDSLIG
ncbi:HEPN domain-containing protein [Mesorhizobium sp. B2-8-5]|uniref:HEPN domain-containing protein n=1 Tax=Mesorhizobium sp. B2-8-5 TaxID=2589903 RepID=UPI00112D8673|nr:HEPN domain-containing protein [Mesorhizobium sp. B2-8-5]UCI24850.1 hypothetical protein FJ430_25205 [Mesorhizobium sp. B2-8-5]